MPEPTYTDDFYAHRRDRANAVAAELHRRNARLHELGTDPERRDLDAEHVVRGEAIGLRNALGILLQPPGGSTPSQRFIEHVGDNYYREWAREQATAEPALHLGNKANAEDCPACAIERRNLPYPFLCPAEPANEAQQAGEGAPRCTCGPDEACGNPCDYEQQAEEDEPEPFGPQVVAYRNPDRPDVLLCREHGGGWQGLTPVTSDDLPDGGLCTWGLPFDEEVCGTDVLIPQAGEGR